MSRTTRPKSSCVSACVTSSRFTAINSIRFSSLRRQRHHRHHRARRSDRAHGHGQRDHRDQPLLDRPGEHRRLRHHRLQDRGLAQRHLRLDRPGRQHQQHRHHLRAHRACLRRHPPLPRVRHQHQRRRHRLQRRQRHHRHHRARRSDRAHGHGQRDHRDQPLLERPGQHRRLRHHRLQDRGLAQRHLRLDRPGRQTTASGTTAINLSWSAPGSTGGSRRTDRAGVRRRRSSSILRVARDPGSAITGYRIEVSSNGGSSWTNLVANTGNATTTYAHTGLTAGAIYSIGQIMFANGLRVGPESDAAEAAKWYRLAAGQGQPLRRTTSRLCTPMGGAFLRTMPKRCAP